MTGSELAAWGRRSVAGFAEHQVAAGLLPPSEAAELARSVFAHELPDGRATAGQHLWTVRDASAVSGEAVGHLWLRVRPGADEAVEAYVMDVDVEEPWRGRGIATAVLRAGQDAARRLGAGVLRLQVFTHNLPAVRLYDRLGYQVVASTMTKLLDGTPPGRSPVDVQLRDMTQDEYAASRVHLEAGYVAGLVAAGAVSPEETAGRAGRDLDRMLLDGPATSGHRLWTAYDGPGATGRPVGHAWVALRHRSDGVHAFGYDLQVRPELRRAGTGRGLVLAAEEELRRLGVRSAELSVSDAGAQAFYERLGFEVTAQTRAKALR